jgi:hypothetical protein
MSLRGSSAVINRLPESERQRLLVTARARQREARTHGMLLLILAAAGTIFGLTVLLLRG